MEHSGSTVGGREIAIKWVLSFTVMIHFGCRHRYCGHKNRTDWQALYLTAAVTRRLTCNSIRGLPERRPKLWRPPNRQLPIRQWRMLLLLRSLPRTDRLRIRVSHMLL